MQQTMQPIVKIKKNNREDLYLGLDTYKEHRVANFRIFVNGKNGAVIATPKGLTIAVEMLDEFIKAAEQVRQEAVQRGWLE